MNCTNPNCHRMPGAKNALVSPKRSEGASVLILVLWISIGLTAIALYFREFHDL